MQLGEPALIVISAPELTKEGSLTIVCSFSPDQCHNVACLHLQGTMHCHLPSVRKVCFA